MNNSTTVRNKTLTCYQNILLKLVKYYKPFVGLDIFAGERFSLLGEPFPFWELPSTLCCVLLVTPGAAGTLNTLSKENSWLLWDDENGFGPRRGYKK